MQLTEKHIVDRSDPRYGALDAACFASKNLYNAALYEMRQAFIFEGCYLTYQQMDRRMQSHEAYRALPAKVAQQVLLLLERNWTSFFAALKAYKADPSTFRRRPQLPSYKHKTTWANRSPSGILFLKRVNGVQYLKMMTNVPIGHPFAQPAMQGKLRCPLLLAAIANGRSYLKHQFTSLKRFTSEEVACEMA